MNIQRKAEPDKHGHLWNDRDVSTEDDNGEWGRYAKCSKCGAIENTDESIKNCFNQRKEIMHSLKNKITWWIAFKLPPRILLWAFVRAYGLDGNGPDGSYKRIYDFIVNKYKLKEGV